MSRRGAYPRARMGDEALTMSEAKPGTGLDSGRELTEALVAIASLANRLDHVESILRERVDLEGMRDAIASLTNRLDRVDRILQTYGGPYAEQP